MRLETSSPVVAGMHRSGTSLVASILSDLGIAMGDSLLEPDANNPKGYFEDRAFLDLNRRMLAAATREDDGGHPDWGWSESEWLDRSRLQEFEDAARALVADRQQPGRRWGFKDPRTTLLLDFWDGLIENPFYVLVYRYPWEVADSMQRLGAAVFLRHPDYAYRIWAFYNSHLLDFTRRHRDRSLLLSTNALRRSPERVAELLCDRLGLNGAASRVGDLLEPHLFRHLEGDDPLIPLVDEAHPGCTALLAELDSTADLSSAGLWSTVRPASRRCQPSDEACPRISVVSPCYDQGEFLLEAVASVERNLQVPFELIIVNDGSREPRTIEVLDILRAAGYQVVDQENLGVATARNRGIELASAPYVLPLDADNKLCPGFVEPALEILEAQPEVGVVYGDRLDFGMRSGTVAVPPFELGRMLSANWIDACAILRKDVWRSCGGYDAEMPIPGWEDWDLWLGASERGWRFHHLPGETFEYRVRPDSMISAFAQEQARLPVLRHIVTKHRDLYAQNMAELVLAAQGSRDGLLEEARLREQRDSVIASLQARVAELTAEVASLSGKRTSLEAEREALGEELEHHREASASAARELAALKAQVRFMEQTRAWRLRQHVITIKSALARLKEDRGV